MSEEKKSKDKKRSSTDTARRIWLAGIGAYGRAFTEAQEALKDVTGKSSDMFDDLVQKGEMIEMVVAAKRKDVVNKAKDAAGIQDLKVPDLHIDERVKKMRSRLLRGEDLSEDIGSVEARLSAVEAKLDRVLKLLEKPRRKTTPKRATTTKTVKKPAPKKTASKK